MARARSAQISASAAENRSRSGPRPSMGRAPDRPLASAITQSLVDMSPSTVMVLKLSSTAPVSAACSTVGEIAASVAMKHSIVAICGWIIPDPLAMATIWIGRPSMLDRARRQLGAQVGGPDRLGRGQRIAAQRRRQRRHRCPHALDRQRRADGPRRRGQDLLGRDPQRLGRRHGDRALVDRAARPGQRVGVAAVGDDGADAHRGQTPGRVVTPARRACG